MGGQYAQFCPVAKTAELLCERWMPLVLRELMLGSTRFGELQRGLGAMSPALLTKRLRQLESAGLLERGERDGHPAYLITVAGRELQPVIHAMGVWGQRWARSSYGPDDLDPSLLMWDIRRMLRPGGLAEQRSVIEFRLPDAPPRRQRYWLVVDDEIDLCLVNPGLEVQLMVEVGLRTLTEIWMGDREMLTALAAGTVTLSGSPVLAQRFPAWLGHHPTLGGVGSARIGVPAGT